MNDNKVCSLGTCNWKTCVKNHLITLCFFSGKYSRTHMSTVSSTNWHQRPVCSVTRVYDDQEPNLVCRSNSMEQTFEPPLLPRSLPWLWFTTGTCKGSTVHKMNNISLVNISSNITFCTLNQFSTTTAKHHCLFKFRTNISTTFSQMPVPPNKTRIPFFQK
jgi:hypothetical protein